MKVLVCAASKYGATSEIAQAVGDVLAGKGLEVSVVPPDQVGAIEEFDAVVLGSAVYMGRWMMARQSGHRLAEERKQRGLTQAQLAETMGVTPGRVSQIERGELCRRIGRRSCDVTMRWKDRARFRGSTGRPVRVVITRS
jgi:DNA-binding XRE family transcriptional regulator